MSEGISWGVEDKKEEMVFVLPKFLGAVSPLAVMSVKISVISEYKYFSPPINKYAVVTNARGGVNLRKVWMKRGVGAIRVCGTPRGRIGHPGGGVGYYLVPAGWSICLLLYTTICIELQNGDGYIYPCKKIGQLG